MHDLDASSLARAGRPFPFAVAAALGLVFLMLTLPPVFAGKKTMLQYGDQAKFHLPQINDIMSDPFDLVGYEATSATTPGHHVLFAWTARLLGYEQVGDETYPLRVLNVLIGLGVVLLAFTLMWRSGADPLMALALVVPLAGSNYVQSAAIWINTDNGATFWYLAGLMTFLFASSRWWQLGIFSFLLVFWRQIYLPVTGAFALTALQLPLRFERIRTALVAVVPPTAMVAVYAIQWQGLTPGTTQTYNELTLSLCVPLHALALTGLLGIVYVPLLWDRVRAIDGQPLRLAAGIAAGIALFFWLASHSNYDGDMGRWGSVVWLFAKKDPTAGHRAVSVLLLAVLGAGMIATMAVDAWRHRYYPIELAMLLMYFLGYSAQVFAWQRYIEPAIVITLGAYLSRAGPSYARWKLAGPVAMGLAFGTLCQLRVWGVVGRMLG